MRKRWINFLKRPDGRVHTPPANASIRRRPLGTMRRVAMPRAIPQIIPGRLNLLQVSSLSNASVSTRHQKIGLPSRRTFIKRIAAATALGAAIRAARRAAAQEALSEKQIEARFGNEMRLAGGNRRNLEMALREAKTDEERRAVGFVIKNMPENDLQNADSAFVLHEVRKAFEARAKYPWAKKVPESVFLSYVVPWRAAEWQQRERRDALEQFTAGIVAGARDELEACYRIQDALGNEKHGFKFETPVINGQKARNPPLAWMLEHKAGRCGEYTTMFCMMCRSVGIPARYVELPIWSHMLDNHAWAEVWTDALPRNSLKGGFQPVNAYGTWAPATKEGVLPWPEGEKRTDKVTALYAYEFEKDETGIAKMRKVNVTRNYRPNDSHSITARYRGGQCKIGVAAEIDVQGKKNYVPIHQTSSMGELTDLGHFGGKISYVVYRIDENGRQVANGVRVESLAENIIVNVP